MASLEIDFWQLRSGEEAHAASPDFWIPPRKARDSLRRGQTAKLIFDVEGEDEVDGIVVQGLRLWVIVSERIGRRYMGLITGPPDIFEPDDEVYLRAAAEVAFDAEHIIDIDTPPKAFAEIMFSEPPTRSWPRD